MGLYDGQQTAFLMTDPGGVGDIAAVPEPNASLVIAAGMGFMALLVALRRRAKV
jgi:hypothetical protein